MTTGHHGKAYHGAQCSRGTRALQAHFHLVRRVMNHVTVAPTPYVLTWHKCNTTHVGHDMPTGQLRPGVSVCPCVTYPAEYSPLLASTYKTRNYGETVDFPRQCECETTAVHICSKTKRKLCLLNPRAQANAESDHTNLENGHDAPLPSNTRCNCCLAYIQADCLISMAPTHKTANDNPTTQTPTAFLCHIA